MKSAANISSATAGGGGGSEGLNIILKENGN